MWDGSGGATLSMTFASATPVSLPNATVNITVYAASYTLSGSVIQAGGLGPLVGAVVNVMDASSGSWIGAGTTDSLGAYSISLSPGTYKLLVQTNSASYPSYMWDGSGGATLSVTFASATPVSLPPNATVNITVYAASYRCSAA